MMQLAFNVMEDRKLYEVLDIRLRRSFSGRKIGALLNTGPANNNGPKMDVGERGPKKGVFPRTELDRCPKIRQYGDPSGPFVLARFSFASNRFLVTFGTCWPLLPSRDRQIDDPAQWT